MTADRMNVQDNLILLTLPLRQSNEEIVGEQKRNSKHSRWDFESRLGSV